MCVVMSLYTSEHIETNVNFKEEFGKDTEGVDWSEKGSTKRNTVLICESFTSRTRRGREEKANY